MSDTQSIPKKTQNLLEKLNTTDEKAIIKTIRLLEAEGNEHVIKPLYALYKKNVDNAIGEVLVEFFDKLADSSAVIPVIELMRNEEDFSHRKMLVTSCWQNKLDFTDYMADFVAIAVDGDFLEAFECLTVIENLEGPIEETQILESQLYLKEFLEKDKGQDVQKDQIISEIALIIKDFDQQIEA